MANTEITRRQRLDQYVIEQFPRLSRGFAVRLIDEGKVLVNGEQEKPGYKIRPADTITIDFADKELDVIPDIDLPVLYEDDNVVVINKPTGVISHARGRYWDEPSVASFIRSYIAEDEFDTQPIEGVASRAGIVHRLDRATSGVMICAKNSATLKFLQRQFGDRNVKKTYVAVVSGHPEQDEAIIDMPIGRNPKLPSTFRVDSEGKNALTHYRVVTSNAGYSMLELSPQTGRTHQLRVHLKQIGHSIVGDTVYDGQQFERLLLHAWKLEITLPGGERRTFEAPVPDIFAEMCA